MQGQTEFVSDATCPIKTPKAVRVNVKIVHPTPRPSPSGTQCVGVAVYADPAHAAVARSFGFS